MQNLLRDLPELTADHIFVMVEDAGKMTTIEQSELWQRLPAVAAGHVYRANIEPSNQSVAPMRFGMIVDDVAATLPTDWRLPACHPKAASRLARISRNSFSTSPFLACAAKTHPL